MRLLFSALLFALIGCHRAPTLPESDQPEAAAAAAPDTTKKISGTVVSFGKHPDLNYQYTVLTYLDDDGMLRDEALPGQDIAADLSLTNRYARRAHLGWIPREGDRFRMTRDDSGNYDVTKIEEK